jgi:hypothetical protein
MRLFLAIFLLFPAGTLLAQDAAERVIAQEVLTRLQPLSFAKGREYCGYIGYWADGTLGATPPMAGDQASCSAIFPRDMAVISSYHTHGDFDAQYFNELPSVTDVESDAKFYMNGYIATPGGRMWYIDSRLKIATQICGLGCLPQSAKFQKGKDGQVAVSYTFDELRVKLDD